MFQALVYFVKKSLTVGNGSFFYILQILPRTPGLLNDIVMACEDNLNEMHICMLDDVFI